MIISEWKTLTSRCRIWAGDRPMSHCTTTRNRAGPLSTCRRKTTLLRGPATSLGPPRLRIQTQWRAPRRLYSSGCAPASRLTTSWSTLTFRRATSRPGCGPPWSPSIKCSTPTTSRSLTFTAPSGSTPRSLPSSLSQAIFQEPCKCTLIIFPITSNSSQLQHQ